MSYTARLRRQALVSLPPVAFTPLALMGNVALERVTISRDVMPHHYVARAVVFDLLPSQMVAAIVAVENRIKDTHPQMFRTGWSAASDGLRIYFSAWTLGGAL